MIPINLQGILWSRDINKLDLEKDKNYIIHQILSSGTWDNVAWLFRTYSIETIRNSFEKYPEKDYTEQSYNFIRNILIETNKDLDKKQYVKTYPRNIRYK